MVCSIPAPASHVVAVQFDGEVSKEDVALVISLIEAGLANSPRINLLFDLTRLEGMKVTALLSDLAYGLKSIGRTYRFQQVAVVSDSQTLDKIISWEDWLFKTVQLKRFPTTERDQALSWVEQKLDLPAPGFVHEEQDSHLVFEIKNEVTGHDVVYFSEIIHARYQAKGPVRVLVYCEGSPKLGPGLFYEKIRQLKLFDLVSRYAIVGPDSLSARVKAADTFLKPRVRLFSPGQDSAALDWLLDETPTVELIPTGRLDRFAIRLSGKISSEEVKGFYTELLPHLRGDNSLDVLLELPYEEGMTFRAMFEVVKLGIKHYTDLTKGIRRLAIITDSRFLTKATELENLIIPSVEERPFTFSQHEIALAWLSEGRPDPQALLGSQLPSADGTNLLASDNP